MMMEFYLLQICYDGFVPLVYFDTLTYCTNAFVDGFVPLVYFDTLTYCTNAFVDDLIFLYET